MSLGFLTESALLPSKAKQIKVDSKSILDLKAVVFQKEQERKERLRRLTQALTGEDGRTEGARRHKRSRGDDDGGDAHADAYEGGDAHMSKNVYARLKAQKRKRGTRDEPTSKNRGVESRSRRDTEQRELDIDNEDDDEALQQKSRAMLEKKAELYEQMMQGNHNAMPSKAVAECLVDFNEKRRATNAPVTAHNNAERGDETVEEEDNWMEITDEFGRTRRVVKGSEAHVAFARTQQQPQSLFYEDKGREEKVIESNGLAGGSFVVSQWEKTLNVSEKQYLEQVHAGVQLTKTTATDKQSRKQQRLEKLRKQQQEQHQQQQQQQQQQVPDQLPSNPMRDTDAAQKATAFLSQFM